jgi:hypothetical protein
MTATEAAAELAAVGYTVKVWRGHRYGSLVTVYYQADGIKGEIWCKSSLFGETVRTENKVWAAIAQIVKA